MTKQMTRTYGLIKNCNYDRDNAVTLAVRAVYRLGSERLVASLDRLEETLEAELTESGNYRSFESEARCTAAENAVETVWSELTDQECHND